MRRTADILKTQNAFFVEQKKSGRNCRLAREKLPKPTIA